MALVLAGVAGACVVVAGFGIWLRRSSGVRRSRAVSRILFVAGLGGLVLFSYPLLYPHHHHDTVWIRDDSRWNYPIDVALGLCYWVAVVALWRAWRSEPRRSRLAV